MRDWYRRTKRNYRNNEARREYERFRYANDSTYRMKKKARNAVCIRVARGTMHPEPCAVCESTSGACAHHNDYTKPLDVVWLCSEHHTMIHGPLPL